jgi:hypothetical protein
VYKESYDYDNTTLKLAKLFGIKLKKIT